MSCFEVEFLLVLDCIVIGVEGWGRVLIKFVVDFVIWKCVLRGVISNDDVFWFVIFLEVSGLFFNVMVIVYVILDEVGYVDVVFFDFIMCGC